MVQTIVHDDDASLGTRAGAVRNAHGSNRAGAVETRLAQRRRHGEQTHPPGLVGGHGDDASRVKTRRDDALHR
jgi:hypothetical protein